MTSSTLVRLWQTKSAARTLSDLLFWSDAPDPAGLPENWGPAYREKIRGELRAISNAFEPGHSVQGLVKECERLAIEFIGLMDNSPGLSIRPRHEWTVPSHCRLFDRLAEIRREFERLADSEDEPAPVVQPVETGSHPESPSEEKWPREEYARDAIIRLRTDKTARGNIAEFCRQIAKEQGIPEIAVSLKKLLYEREYKQLWKT